MGQIRPCAFLRARVWDGIEVWWGKLAAGCRACCHSLNLALSTTAVGCRQLKQRSAILSRANSRHCAAAGPAPYCIERCCCKAPSCSLVRTISGRRARSNTAVSEQLRITWSLSAARAIPATGTGRLRSDYRFNVYRWGSARACWLYPSKNAVSRPL